MKQAGIFSYLILILAMVAYSSSLTFAAADGFYLLSPTTYTWENIETNPTADYVSTYGDESSVTYSLPAAFGSFPFYGQTYSQITADTNGNIWFGSSGSAHSFDLASNGRGPVIAAWNNDLSSYFYGGVFIQHNTGPERVVIVWQTETYTNEGLNMPNSFEAVLYPDGTIRLDYKSFASAATNKDFGSGISKGDGTNFLNLTNLYDNAYALTGRSFQHVYDPPWVQGNVKDSANNPLAGVEVQIRNADSTIIERVLTAADGSYSLATYAGNWLVDALTENANWSPVPEQSVTLTAGQTATVDFTVNTVAITPSTLADGIYNTSYNQTLTATGGMTPYNWSITAGALPAGLNLITSTGVIIGTPTTVGADTFTVQVQDVNGFTATKNLSIASSYLPVMIAGSTPTYYSSLQAAYNGAADGDTIQCRAVELTENLTFNLNKSITVIGGYDSQFATSTGVTTIHGAVNVTAGTVPMRSVNLQY